MKKILVLIALSGFHFLCSKYSFGRNGSRQSKLSLKWLMSWPLTKTKAMDAYAITTDKGKFSLKKPILRTSLSLVIWVCKIKKSP
jgi:hypothetical protein